MPEFVEHLDANNIRVRAPTPVVFLCGGETSSVSESKPASLRDAFLKIADNPATRGRAVVMAEDVNVFYLGQADYKDLLSFETELAQICELILLFSESEGSLAELGAFSMVEEISDRLLVVVRDKYYTSKSFVKLGPLQALENRYGPEAVYVLDDNDIGMRGESTRDVNIAVLCARLQSPITRRLEQMREPSRFDQSRPGHMIKLIVGLVQEYGGLTVPEIEHLLAVIGCPRTRSQIGGYLLCAETVGWVKEKRKGATNYFFALPVGDAAQLPLSPSAQVRERLRRRALIREYWREQDGDRYRGIVEAVGGGL